MLFRSVLGGCDQIDIVSPFLLQPEKDIRQLTGGQFLAGVVLADGIILAKAATQSTAAEKYGSTASYAADTRLFPMMERCPCCPYNGGASAKACGSGPVNSAVSGAKHAMLHCRFTKDICRILHKSIPFGNFYFSYESPEAK